MRFKGKVAVWWYLIIAALNAVLVWMIVKYGLHYISYFYILPAGLLDLYLIPVCFANYVEIDKKKLFIRFGISKEELLIEDITAMHRADRLTLSYCASTERPCTEPTGSRCLTAPPRTWSFWEPEIRKMWWYR